MTERSVEDWIENWGWFAAWWGDQQVCEPAVGTQQWQAGSPTHAIHTHRYRGGHKRVEEITQKYYTLTIWKQVVPLLQWFPQCTGLKQNCQAYNCLNMNEAISLKCCCRSTAWMYKRLYHQMAMGLYNWWFYKELYSFKLDKLLPFTIGSCSSEEPHFLGFSASNDSIELNLKNHWRFIIFKSAI